MKKTPAEVDELKRQWQADPCWDIEDTEGFEEHKTELYIFRLEQERNDYRAQYQAYRKLFRLMHNAIQGDVTELL